VTVLTALTLAPGADAAVRSLAVLARAVPRPSSSTTDPDQVPLVVRRADELGLASVDDEAYERDP
jgi:hypothetical protein